MPARVVTIAASCKEVGGMRGVAGIQRIYKAMQIHSTVYKLLTAATHYLHTSIKLAQT